MRPTRTLLGSVGWLSAGSLVTRIVGAVGGIISARALGVEGRGQLAVLLVVGVFAGALLPAGLDLWAARSLGGGAPMDGVRSVLVQQLLIVATSTVAVASVVMSTGAAAPAVVCATALLCFASVAATMKLGVLQGLHQLRRFAGALLAGTATYTASLATLALLGAASVTSFLSAAALGQLVVAGWPVRDGRSCIEPRSMQLRDALRFGVPTAFGGVVALLLYRIDLLLVSAWGGVDEAGLYSVALVVTEVVWIVPTAAAQAVLPRAAGSSTSGAGSPGETAQLSRSLVVLMVVTALGVIAIAPVAVPLLFGADFDGAVDAVPVLALAAVPVGLWKLLGHALLGGGDAASRLSSGMIGVGVMVAADAVLVPEFGIRGAAAGSLMAYAAAGAVVVRQWARHTGLTPAEAILPRRSDASYLRHRLIGGPRGGARDG